MLSFLTVVIYQLLLDTKTMSRCYFAVNLFDSKLTEADRERQDRWELYFFLLILLILMNPICYLKMCCFDCKIFHLSTQKSNQHRLLAQIYVNLPNEILFKSKVNPSDNFIQNFHENIEFWNICFGFALLRNVAHSADKSEEKEKRNDRKTKIKHPK